MSFILKTAWRDSRRSRQRLLLFMSAIVLGIAALVAINSFGDNLARSIDEQAQELLGADLTVTASHRRHRKKQRICYRALAMSEVVKQPLPLWSYFRARVGYGWRR